MSTCGFIDSDTEQIYFESWGTGLKQSSWAANITGPNYMLGYDDVVLGKAKLAGLEFEGAVFGHGKPMLSGASNKFAAKFG